MKVIKTLAAVTTCGLGLLGMSGAAHATAVTCGNSSLGTRTVTVDPALVGGYCYGQNGNLQNSQITSLGFTLVDKNSVNGLSVYSGSTSGSWSIDADLWTLYKDLYIAFHFGGGGNNTDDNPDSFIVQLSPYDTSGTWQLGGGQLNGLSNFYVLGHPCEEGDECGPPDEVPEPGTLALLGLGLLGLGMGRKRLQA